MRHDALATLGSCPFLGRRWPSLTAVPDEGCSNGLTCEWALKLCGAYGSVVTKPINTPQAPTSLRCNVLGARRKPSHKFQALVYDIFPPTTAIVNYATGLEKLTANGQFFVGAQMAVNV